MLNPTSCCEIAIDMNPIHHSLNQTPHRVTMATMVEWGINHDKPTYLGHYNIWVNYNDLTATSLEIVVRGINPKWP